LPGDQLRLQQLRKALSTLIRSSMPYPQAKSADPIYLKNFDPKTFYPALANAEGLEPRADSISIRPSSSISQQSIRHPEPDPELFPTYVPCRWLSKCAEGERKDTADNSRRDTWVREHHISRRKLWAITTGVAISVIIIVLIFAWLGAHNFFKDQPVTFP